MAKKLLQKQPKNIFEVLAVAVQKKNADGYAMRDRNYTHPSQVSACPKETLLTRTGFKQTGGTLPFKTLRIFDNGTAVHERIQSYYVSAGIIEGLFSCRNQECNRDLMKLKPRFKKNGLPIIISVPQNYLGQTNRNINCGFVSITPSQAKVSCIPYHIKATVKNKTGSYRVKWYATEQEDYCCPMCGSDKVVYEEIMVFAPELGLYGHCDGLIHHPLLKRRMLLEIKSANQFYYGMPISDGYIDQAECYMLALGFDEISFQFENKNDQTIKEEVVKSRRDNRKNMIAKLMKIEKAMLNTGKNMPMPCEEEDPEYFQKSCRQLGNCVGLRKSEMETARLETYGKIGYESRVDIYKEKFLFPWRYENDIAKAKKSKK